MSRNIMKVWNPDEDLMMKFQEMTSSGGDDDGLHGEICLMDFMKFQDIIDVKEKILLLFLKKIEIDKSLENCLH